MLGPVLLSLSLSPLVSVPLPQHKFGLVEAGVERSRYWHGFRFWWWSLGARGSGGSPLGPRESST